MRAGGPARFGIAFALLAALLLSASATAQDAAPPAAELELRRIASVQQPTYVIQAPGDPRTLFVSEQRGMVIAIRDGHKAPRPFLNITDRVAFGYRETESIEAGLYSLAFDPDYARNGRFFVFYTGSNGDNYVDEYRRSGRRPLRASAASRRPVLKISHPWDDSHNGGQLQFGPDGFLWVGTGDGGCCGDYHDQARSLGTKLGKLLRIDPRRRAAGFRAPNSNPLVGVPGVNAVYSWGLRNPWRFSFDRLTGDLFVADVGDNERAREEIDYVGSARAAKANFGWPEYEGFRLRDPLRPGPEPPIAPIYAYSHGRNRCAITGGYVVRDPALAQLYGRYLFADFCGGRLASLAPPPLSEGLPPAGRVADVRDEGLFVRRPTSFGEGLEGEIYVTSYDGPVYRLQPRRAGPASGSQ